MLLEVTLAGSIEVTEEALVTLFTRGQSMLHFVMHRHNAFSDATEVALQTLNTISSMFLAVSPVNMSLVIARIYCCISAGRTAQFSFTCSIELPIYALPIPFQLHIYAM